MLRTCGPVHTNLSFSSILCSTFFYTSWKILVSLIPIASSWKRRSMAYTWLTCRYILRLCLVTRWTRWSLYLRKKKSIHKLTRRLWWKFASLLILLKRNGGSESLFHIHKIFALEKNLVICKVIEWTSMFLISPSMIGKSMEKLKKLCR